MLLSSISVLLRIRNIISVWVFWDSDANMKFHMQESKWKKHIWSKQKLKVSPDHDASLAPVKGETPGRIIGKEEPHAATQMWEILSQTEISPEQSLPFRSFLCWVSPGKPTLLRHWQGASWVGHVICIHNMEDLNVGHLEVAHQLLSSEEFLLV